MMCRENEKRKTCGASELCNSGNTMLRMLLIVGTFGLMELTFAADIKLQWDTPANNTGIEGYEVNYGVAQGGPYGSGSVTVSGKETSTATVSEQKSGTYYAAVRSCSSCGTVSAVYSTYSNEVNFTVGSAANHPPTITNPGAQSGTEGDPVSLIISASDADGDTLAYSASGLPVGLGIDSQNGLISGTLLKAGTYGVTVTVSDGSVQASASFSWAAARSGNPVAGLVAAYGFEGTDGVIVTDVSGNSNDGVIDGASRTTAGRFGSAVAFDGVDDAIDLNAVDISGGDGLTISVWMKADDFGTYDARLVSKATGVYDDDHYWMLSTFSNNSVRFRLKTDGSTTTLISTNGVVDAGQWHHVAATYDGLSMRLYVDGVQVGSTAKAGLVDTNPSVPVAIGDQPQGDRPFDGLIDEVRLYNRGLTAAEIQADMKTPIGGDSTDTDGDGILDAEDPDDDNDGVNDANDSAPLDASNSGQVLALLDNDTDPGEHGYLYGDGSYYTVLAATFDGDGSDKLLHVQGYDIDNAQEVAVYVNSTFLGYLSPGPNNALNTPSLWWLPAALQVNGENRIELVESNPGWRWGVTNLGLYAPGSAFGNLTTFAEGDRNHAAGFELHLGGSTDGYLLELTGYDIDGGAEVGLDLNGSPLVDLPAGNNNDWSQSDHLVLPADLLDVDDNVLFVQNVQNSTYNWGLRLDRLLPRNAALGNTLPGQAKADYRHDAVRYLIPPVTGGSVFDLSFYDVDTSLELELLQDGVSLGYAATTGNDAWGVPESIAIPAGQSTLVEINNTYNPPLYYLWGVRLQ